MGHCLHIFVHQTDFKWLYTQKLYILDPNIDKGFDLEKEMRFEILIPL